MGDQGDLYQIALLIDQLKHEDTLQRLNASKELVRISQALGPERTRNELIPFLSESIDDEDNVICVIAKKLGELVECVGGSEYAHTLLTPLELLAKVEESKAREIAIESIEVIASSMDSDHVVQYFIPFINKLGTKDWFTSRASAAALVHVGYSRVPSAAARDLRQLFLKLCSDETPMVRRIAAQNIGNIVAARNDENQEEFLSTFDHLTRDEQDSVRTQIVSNCVIFIKSLTLDNRLKRILPILTNIAGDHSWRVRWNVAKKMHEISSSIFEGSSGRSKHETQGNLTTVRDMFERLLNDTEAEVRSSAAGGFTAMCGLLHSCAYALSDGDSNFGASLVSRLLDSIKRLVNDESEHVRIALGGNISGLGRIIGKNETIEHLLPLLLIMLRDESSEVRLNVISSLPAINEVLGIELLSQSLLPAVLILAEDNQWRVRLSIIEHIPMLAEQLGVDFFNEKLSAQCMQWMSDSVYAVRRASTENLVKLCDILGDDWTRKSVIPSVIALLTTPNYLHRVTALYGMQALAQSISRDIVESVVLPAITVCVTDAVPNVRFTVAKTLRSLYWDHLVGDDDLRGQMWGLLQKMADDNDRDVRFYATSALTSAQ